MGVEVAFGLFAVTATSAVKGLVAGVVERSLAGIDSRLAIRLGAFRRIPDGDPLGIAFEPASHICFLLSPASAPAAGRAALCFGFPRNIFRGDLSPKSGGRSADSRCASGAGGRTCQSESGPEGWRVVLAQRTPPMRAAAKRRSQERLGSGAEPRRGVYGALAGRLTA